MLGIKKYYEIKILDKKTKNIGGFFFGKNFIFQNKNKTPVLKL